MKVTLIKAPCIEPVFPPDIGLGYLSSFLSDLGHQVSIFDLNIETFNLVDGAIKEKWLDRNTGAEQLNGLGDELSCGYREDYAKKILMENPRIVGFSVWDSNIKFSLRLAEEIKKSDKDVIIIFGGPACYPLYSGNNLIKEHFIDIVVYGEGELTLKEIIESIEKNVEIKFCPGCLVKKHDSIVDFGMRKPVVDLDSLPFPDWRNFPLQRYLNKNQLFISFSRGCIQKCVYCEVPGTAPFYRFRRAESIYEEIRLHIDRHPQVDNFTVASPELNSNLKEVSRLCDLLLENNIKICWTGNAILRPDMGIGLLKKMKESGCNSLIFGIESGSQRVLNKMGKKLMVEDIERILRDCQDVDIKVVANFIIGFPGETGADFKETIRFLERNKEYIDTIGSRDSCWISPYSAIYDNPERFSLVHPNLNINYFLWQDKESNENSPESREEKKKYFAELVSSLGVKHHYDKIS